jgi:hypothetical protein
VSAEKPSAPEVSRHSAAHGPLDTLQLGFKAGRLPKKRPKNSYRKWDHLIIEFLIQETHDYIVFLDDALEVDWETSEKYEEDKREPAGFTDLRRQYSELESSISDGVSHGNRKLAERLIALGIEAGLGGDVDAGKRCMETAAEFIDVRNKEVGKRRYVWGAVGASAVFVVCGTIAWALRSYVEPVLGDLPFSLLLYGAGGSAGALFFVLRGVGLALPDPQADNALHVTEAVCRIVLGVVGAVVVVLAVRTGLLLGPLMTFPYAHYVLMLVAIVAGKSETLAPDLMHKLETGVGKNDPSRLGAKRKGSK